MRFSSHLIEHILGIVVFSVEVFNALYVTIYMRSGKSTMTNIDIILLDLAEMAHAFHDMKGQLASLQRMQKYYAASSGRNLLDIVLSICEDPEVLEGNENRMYSSVELRKFPLFVKPVKIQPQRRSEKRVRGTIMAHSIHPIHEKLTESKLSISPPSRTTAPVSVAEKRKFVVHSLNVLFQCEYHVLAEYVEAVISLAYSVYVAVLCELNRYCYEQLKRR